MDLIIGNTAGWWALLGVPAVLGIHLLQHEARRHRVSTLFLLDHLAMEGVQGRMVDRVRNSASLWLQLAVVLMLTWVLVQPRWIREDSFQRVVVVLDSSVSMRAFHDRLPGALADELAAWAEASARTEWRLIETDPGRESLYAGERLGELVKRVREWRPRLGTHSAEPAFQAARSLAGPRGTVIFLSDRRPERLPDGIELLAVGDPVDNVGFCGLRIDESPGDGLPAWQAMVRNFGATPQRRGWAVAVGDGRQPAGVLELAAGEARVLRGTYPDTPEPVALELEGDQFAIDDRLPMVRPRPKRIRVSRRVDPAAVVLVDRFLSSLDAVDFVPRSAAPDLEILGYAPGVIPSSVAHTISLPRPVPIDRAEVPPPAAMPVAEDHPLTEGLNWRSLLCRPLPDPALRADDTVLVWQGDVPLIVLRGPRDRRNLVVSFDLGSSNAARVPAFVLLLHRFVEQVRRDTIAPAVRNLEVNQALSLAVDPAGGDLEIRDAAGTRTVSVSRAPLLRSPSEPGWFEVAQGTNRLLRAAVRFADAREADFRAAERLPLPPGTAEPIRRRNSRPDAWTPFWILLAGAALLASWALPGRTA